MFLNQLVKHIEDTQNTSEKLRHALRCPKDIDEALKRMRAFYAYIEEVIRTKNVAKRNLQHARVPFFVSSWWHFQNSQG